MALDKFSLATHTYKGKQYVFLNVERTKCRTTGEWYNVARYLQLEDRRVYSRLEQDFLEKFEKLEDNEVQPKNRSRKRKIKLARRTKR